MLVLTRKQGEKIRIGDDVVITVVRTKGKAVRLGIQAPVHVPVLRGEIARAIADETRPAAASEDGESLEADPGEGSETIRMCVDSRTCSAGAASEGSYRGPLRAAMDARC